MRAWRVVVLVRMDSDAHAAVLSPFFVVPFHCSFFNKEQQQHDECKEMQLVRIHGRWSSLCVRAAWKSW